MRIGEEEGDAPDHTHKLAAMIDQCLPYPGQLERDWILWVELWLRAVRHPELRPTAGDLYERMRTWFADAIAAGARAGEFDWPPTPIGSRIASGALRRVRRALAARRPRDRAGPGGGLGGGVQGLGGRPVAATARRVVARRAALAALLVALGLPGGARAEPVTVMTFNVWYGGVQVDFPSIGRAIRAADADIVGVQEPEGAAAPDRPLRGTGRTSTRRCT